MTPEFEAQIRAQSAVIAVYEQAMTPTERAAFRWGTGNNFPAADPCPECHPDDPSARVRYRCARHEEKP